MGPHLHLDHDDHDRRRYLGFSHSDCNRSAAGRKARAQQTAPADGCRYCGRTLPHPGRTYCTRRCGHLGTRHRPKQLTLPYPPLGPKPKPQPPPRQCRLCGATFAAAKRLYCTEACTLEYGARSGREAYRARAGLTPTWHEPTSRLDRWQGPVHELLVTKRTAPEVTHSEVTEWITASRRERGEAC